MAEKKINESTYRVEKILAKDSLVLKARIMQVLGVGAARLPEILLGVGGGKNHEDEEKSNSAAVAAFADIFVKGNPQKMADLVEDIAHVAMIRTETGSYERVNIDRDFTGDDKGLFSLVVFVLKEVFGDFLPGALDIGLQKIQEKIPAQTSQNKS